MVGAPDEGSLNDRVATSINRLVEFEVAQTMHELEKAEKAENIANDNLLLLK